MGTSSMKNSVDNESNSPQYLGVASLYLPQLGNDFEFGPPSREKLFTEETSCQQRKRLPRKRNTNRARDDTSQQQKFRKASREKHLSGGFLLTRPGEKQTKMLRSRNEGLSGTSGHARKR
jgi:hypothetical protein